MPTLAGQITRNFSWREAACHADPPVPVPGEYHGNVRAVAKELEKIRQCCGNRPLTVTRIYSTPAHNKAVGGAPRSQHLVGNAADIVPPIANMTTVDLGRIVQMLANEPESRVRFVRVYNTHVHFDLRPGSRVIVEGL